MYVHYTHSYLLLLFYIPQVISALTGDKELRPRAFIITTNAFFNNNNKKKEADGIVRR